MSNTQEDTPQIQQPFSNSVNDNNSFQSATNRTEGNYGGFENAVSEEATLPSDDSEFPAVGDDNENSAGVNSGPINFMISTTRSGRKVQPTAKFMETISRGDYTAFESTFVDGSDEADLEKYL